MATFIVHAARRAREGDELPHGAHVEHAAVVVVSTEVLGRPLSARRVGRGQGHAYEDKDESSLQRHLVGQFLTGIQVENLE